MIRDLPRQVLAIHGGAAKTPPGFCALAHWWIARSEGDGKRVPEATHFGEALARVGFVMPLGARHPPGEALRAFGSVCRTGRRRSQVAWAMLG